VCFTLVFSSPSIALPHPSTSHPQLFNSFQYTSLQPLPSHVTMCGITVALLFSFLSLFPRFHRVVHCSTSEFAYDYGCLCLCLSLIYLPHMREDMCLLCSWS
jgi:hypothetical protein